MAVVVEVVLRYKVAIGVVEEQTRAFVFVAAVLHKRVLPGIDYGDSIVKRSRNPIQDEQVAA